MNKFNLDKVKANLDRVKREVPALLANQAENHFTDNFKRQGFDNDRWKEVQRRIAGTRPYLYPKSRGLSRRKKPILIGTGRLRRAVANSKKRVTFDKIILEVNLPYAANHNEGITLPKRQYMGDSKELRRKQKDLIIKTVDKIWQA